MTYDVVIVGGGVIGCSIARQLSKYKLKTILLEKHNDVCNETSNANSAIVHSGYDPEPGTNKAIYNVKGNAMFKQLCEDLDVPFYQLGSITVAMDESQIETLKALQVRATENGVPTQMLTQKELQELEPNLNKTLVGGLLAPTAGIVCPFELTVALMENAMDNGAELKLNAEVVNIVEQGDLFKVSLANGEEVEGKVVINAAGLYSDEIAKFIDKDSFTIMPRKGQYCVLDHFQRGWVKHTIFMVPSDKGKGVLVSPTTSGNYIIGPSSDFVEEKDDVSTTADVLAGVKAQAKNIIENIPYQHMIRQYSGLRAVSSTGDFIIEHSKANKNFINVAGIQSPGLASSPAIAEKVVELVKDCLETKENENYNPKRRPVIRMKWLPLEEKNRIIKEDPTFGHIICRCEKISEGEIMDCINRNCGATTVKGVKKRCRPGFGLCQGAMCEPNVIKIIARELHRSPDSILYNEKDTEIMKYETKVGDHCDK